MKDTDTSSPRKLAGTARCLALVAVLGPLLGACHGKYIRPTSPEKFQATPERLQRGQYLVNQVMACGACHTSRATGNLFLEGEQTDLFLAGGNVLEDPGMGRLYIPNLTPDAEGLGGWTDDEILRAVRDGVHKDGHFLVPMMPYDNYQHLSDEDGKALVVYLRSIPAAKAPRPRFAPELKFFPKVLFTTIGVQMHKPRTDVATPDRNDHVAYGHYLAEVGACTDCHSMTSKGPRKETDPLFMAGGDVPFTDPRLGKVWARNLTPDPDTGLGKYKPDQIKAALRDGKRLDGKRMAPPMSVMIPHISGLTDEDLDALVAYLGSLKPANHAITEPQLTPEAQKMLAP
jgi:cytochrome c553/mono/diheme cytochrome c family protein